MKIIKILLVGVGIIFGLTEAIRSTSGADPLRECAQHCRNTFRNSLYNTEKGACMNCCTIMFVNGKLNDSAICKNATKT